MERLYWGIVSAGKICHDFVNALNDPSGPAAANNKVVAVAARQMDRAKMFGDKHGIHTVYGDYKDLADNGDINAIYVGNITSRHYDVCKMMLHAGKHVLCEKSLTTNYSQSKELYNLAKSKNLMLMEAVWSNFLPTYKELEKRISAGAIGKVLHMEGSLGLDIELLPDGAGLDLGIYPLNLARLVFDREEPEEIIVRGSKCPSGVDASWDAILVFKGDRRAVLKCSSKYKLSNTAHIAGTGGTIEVPYPMHCPTGFTVTSGPPYSMTLPDQPAHPYNYENSAGLSYEAAAFCEAVRSDKLECSEYTPEDSLYIARILGEIQRQIGVTFDI